MCDAKNFVPYMTLLGIFKRAIQNSNHPPLTIESIKKNNVQQIMNFFYWKKKKEHYSRELIVGYLK